MANENESKETIQKRLETDFFAEKRLLRALFNTPELMDDQRVNIDMLSSMSTKNVYIALENLKKNGIKPTRDSLMQEYSVIDLDANSYIVDVVADNSTVETDITDMINQLSDFKKRREAVSQLKAAITLIEKCARISEQDIEKVTDVISNAKESLISGGINRDIQKLMNTSEWFEQYIPEFMKRQNGKTYWFRNYMFDKLVPDGPQPGEIGIIASASGSGKSTVCSNLVNNMIETNVPCMYYSLEMSSAAIMDRLLAKRCHIKYSKFKDPGEDFDDILLTIKAERKTMEENPLFRFCESGDVSLKKIEEDVLRVQMETGCNYWVVVIDLLSMVSDFTRFVNGANFSQGIEVAINKLSALAKRLGIHIIGVLQLNRAAEADSSIHSIDDLDKLKPNRAQIKNANAFLERSRYVITTFRKKMYAKLNLQPEEYEDMDDIIEVSIVKLNNGEIGETEKGVFDGEYFDILPIEREEDPMDELDSQFD